jgi:Ca2+:H+ antiporter|eukprot:COSAG06_NODE_7523_length_2471_cov_14.736931_2_plen_219_part_00
MSADPLIMPPERSPSPAVRATAERAAARVSQKRAGIVRSELGLIFGVATLFIFQLFGTPWVANLQNTAKAVGLFLWLFAAILALSFGVVRHADCLAVLLGEPYGTLILTLSVIGIEAAMMAQLMLNGEDSPTLARDTMFSVLMIVLTGIVGVTLLLGGLFNPQQQEFNLSGALSYLRVLTPMAILSLVVPRFTRKDGGEIWGPLGAETPTFLRHLFLV